MRMPDAGRAYVPREKLTDYVLSPGHPVGRHKAWLLARAGFSLANWQELETLQMTELEVAVLAREVPEYGLRAGDVGTIVHAYADRRAVEVEFVTAEGRTIAVLALDTEDVRPMSDGEILHARDLAGSAVS